MKEKKRSRANGVTKCVICGKPICMHLNFVVRRAISAIDTTKIFACRDCGEVSYGRLPPKYLVPMRDGLFYASSMEFFEVCRECCDKIYHDFAMEKIED